MRRMWGAFVVLLLSTTVHATDSLIRNAAVNGFALGFAAVAQKAGVEAMIVNPAGILPDNRSHLQTGYSSHFQNLYQTVFVGYSIPTYTNIGIGVVVAGRMVDSIPESISNSGLGEITGSFSDSEYQAKVGISMKMNTDWSVGASVGYYGHQILSESANQLSVDVGIQGRLGFADIGASVLNITAAPKNWSTGLVQPVDRHLIFGAELPLSARTRLMASQSLEDGDSRTNVGIATELIQQLEISAGAEDVFGEWMAAVGLKLELDSFQLTYSYGHSGELGGTHKLGIQIGI